ncbi:GATA type transcriptional activator of nitrogen-regulated proteins [Coemansia asiatica]|nr:GATA type transcriptional activator of nitrogen-regulated proteins [Coemansia asiatica]
MSLASKTEQAGESTLFDGENTANSSKEPSPGIKTSPPLSRAGITNPDKQIICMNCKTTSTPLWRRDPTSGSHLCNRCGLYLKTYNVMHPLTKIKRRAISVVANKRADPVKPLDTNETAEIDDVEQVPRPPNCHPMQLQQLDVRVVQKKRVTPKQQISLGMTPRCSNCCAEQTPLWRRDHKDNIICNACGLYFKLHGKARPVSMKRAAVKRRNRTTAAHYRRQSSALSLAAAAAEATMLSVPAEESDGQGSKSGDNRVVEHGPLKADALMGGLQFLMKAAELSPLCVASQISKHATSGSNSGFGMLESLASVAAAEISSSTSATNDAAAAASSCEQGEHGRKQELQRECLHLEQLLAQSKAKLSEMC